MNLAEKTTPRPLVVHECTGFVTPPKAVPEGTTRFNVRKTGLLCIRKRHFENVAAAMCTGAQYVTLISNNGFSKIRDG
jgi:hypothetical protein